MRRRRKILLSLAASIVILVVAAPLWLPFVANLAEPFIRSQVLEIASKYLKPRIELGQLEYSFPLSVDIIDLKLVSTDEDGNDLVLLDAPRVGITLDRIPIFSGALVFRDFEIDDVKVRLISDSSGSLAGWSDLLENDDTTTGDDAGDAAPLSAIFSIDRITVKDMTLEYSLAGNPNTMVLDALDFEIDNKSRKGDEIIELDRGPGWYGVDTILEREGLFKITVDGGIDLDSLMLDLDSLDVDLLIDDQSAGYLPPQFQGIIKDRQINGRIDGSINGRLSLKDPKSDDTTFSIALRPTTMAVDDYVLDVAKAEIKGQYRNETFVIDPFEIDVFDGVVSGTIRIADETMRGLSDEEMQRSELEKTADPGEDVAQTDSKFDDGVAAVQSLSQDYLPAGAFDSAIKLATGLRLFASLDLDKLRLSKVHRIAASDPKKIAGDVSGGFEVDFNLGRPMASLGGGGQIEVVNGRFTGGPLVGALAKVMRVVTLSVTEKDWAIAEIMIRDERIQITNIEALAGPIGVRGKGWVGLDGRLDLELNGGPLEGLQATAGKIGQLTGFVTDRFAKYVVSGRLEDPKVKVAPLGIRLNKPE
ncbi:MAG: hypothetical protein GY895_08430 [Phycisphaera sp.]|nr:hypothetical protein [Phycisphaera sp.]